MGLETTAICAGRKCIDDEEFNFLICPICCDLFKGPVFQCIWGHSFCGECIAQWLGKKPTCPQCRNSMAKGRICRNLLIEQAIDELALKNKIKKPVCVPQVFLKTLPESFDSENDDSKRKMMLKVFGCNFLILAIFFAGVAVCFEDNIRSVNQEPAVSKSESEFQTTKFLTNTTAATRDEHMPMDVVISELAYYVATGTTVTFSFLVKKAAFAVKVVLSLALWISIKLFVGFSLLLECAGICAKWILGGLCGYLIDTISALANANAELAEYFTAIVG